MFVPASTFGFRLIPKNFFFDRARVLAAESRATIKYLNRAGGFVMVTARRSMRKARRKKISELSVHERRLFRIRQAMARRQGLPIPKLPFAHSKPGEPPRVIQGNLKRFTFYAYDPARRSVVVGPVGFNGSPVPRALEYGGRVPGSRGGMVVIKPRPFMNPALEKVQSRLAEFWAQAFRSTATRAG